MGELQLLQDSIARLVPDAKLVWRELEECRGLGGYLLEEEAALRPLPAELASKVADSPPFWALLWPSGQALCRILASDPLLVTNTRVLDFGCGCGLVACAAAAGGAETILAVDLDPLARTAARVNANRNRVSIDIKPEASLASADLLLLADVLYDEDQLQGLYGMQLSLPEVFVVDSRLRKLEWEGFSYLGECSGQALPDLDPQREFGRLRFWYRGNRRRQWLRAGLFAKPCTS